MKGSIHDFTKYLTRENKMGRFFKLLKSKTVWGSLFGAGAYLAGVDSIGLPEIITAGGAVFAAIGVKDNFSKIQQGKVDPPRGENFNSGGI